MSACPTCGARREHRSRASHDHYFAAVQNAFDNLPESLSNDFPTAEHLRKWALIKAGYRDERTFVASSGNEAMRLAVYLRPIDSYAFCMVDGDRVTHCTAKSQSLKAMGKAEFQRSKDAVLRELAILIGVDVADLRNVQAA